MNTTRKAMQHIKPPHPYYNLSKFQRGVCEAIEAQPEFDRWVGMYTACTEVQEQGTRELSWYDKDGRVFAIRMGRSKIIEPVTI